MTGRKQTGYRWYWWFQNTNETIILRLFLRNKQEIVKNSKPDVIMLSLAWNDILFQDCYCWVRCQSIYGDITPLAFEPFKICNQIPYTGQNVSKLIGRCQIPRLCWGGGWLNTYKLISTDTNDNQKLVATVLCICYKRLMMVRSCHWLLKNTFYSKDMVW